MNTKRQILTPCPPRKHCHICESRMNEVFGSTSHVPKYLHQSSEAGLEAKRLLDSGDIIGAVASAVRAASFANLAMDGRA